MRNLCKYEQYKVLKNNFITEVPISWDMIKLKYVANIYNGNSLNDDYKLQFESENDDELPYIASKDINVETTEINYQNGTRIPKNFENLKIAPKHSSLLCIEGGSAGRKMGFTNQDVYFVNKLACFNVEDEVTSKFIFYILQSNHFQSQFYNALTGLIGGVSLSNLRNFNFPLPSIQEQFSIVYFLNQQTSLIDEIITRKEKQIELLKEKRQATINEAVTKGINPNAKMRDSRIEWLGEIPEDWELRNLEVVAKDNRYSITGGPFGSDLKNEEYTEHGVRIIQLQNIGVGEFCDDYKIYTSEEKADYLFSSNIYPGEIIIAKMADPVARACIVPNTADRFIMASDGIRLEVDNDRFITKFIEYSINSKYFNYQAELNSTGTTRLRIGLTTLKKLKLLLPQLTEQVEIVEYLESYNKIFLEIFEKLSLQIQKLKEYRQSIISEAVTGKIDVRDWQPNNSSN